MTSDDRIDCLILSYSEASRDRERHQFDEVGPDGDGWARFLRLNYVGWRGDILLPNQLLSLASRPGPPRRDDQGHFHESDLSAFSAWKIPLLGGLYLYQHLKHHGLQVDIVQHAQLEADALERKLARSPRVIGISTTLILNPLDILDLVRFCRERSPDAVIVLGGCSVWNAYLSKPDRPKIFETLGADAVVVDAKGHETLRTLVQAVRDGTDLASVPNLFLYTGATPIATPRDPDPFSFATHPMRWSEIDAERLGPIHLVRTQVSCPFACAFCSYPTTAGAVLQADMDCLRAELDALVNAGVTHVLFIDDTFNVPIRRFRRMLEILKEYRLSWYAFIRCQYLDADQARAMAESGCRGAYLGIESGSDAILTAMNKRATRQQYLDGVALLKANRIPTYASFIVGFPGETRQTYDETVSFIRDSGIDFYNVKIFFLDRTTPIAADAAKHGLKGHGMHWRHDTMDSVEAFGLAEELIRSIDQIPYIPQHSGEIWEMAYLDQQGFTAADLEALYGGFTEILQTQLRGEAIEDTLLRVFSNLQGICHRVAARPGPAG